NVVTEFKEAIPDAKIYVYDNNSSDNTAKIANESGAIVRKVRKQGKGYVLQQMFSQINAEVYLLVDGDSTYDVKTAPELINAVLQDGYDMAVACRKAVDSSSYRVGHKFGNKLLTGAVNKIFGDSAKDMLSGYRSLSNRFVKSFPINSTGFEVETEITIHAFELKMAVIEIPSLYKPRPENSISKLNTYSDGIRILLVIINLFRQEKPLVFFFIIAIVLALISTILIFPVLLEYLKSGLVPRLPSAILSMGIMLVSILFVISGLILDTVTKGRQEIKRLKFLEL
ncbi:glycosyltransferase family 2 protein, partial [Candidatus Pseudothioglobus singularis]|nr:glycosyltransferase family 2 protein [Candidatus Pseudothioglobus singularis]